MSENYDFQQVEEGVPIKMWTRGVPVDDKARDQLSRAARMPFIFRHVAAMPELREQRPRYHRIQPVRPRQPMQYLWTSWLNGPFSWRVRIVSSGSPPSVFHPNRNDAGRRTRRSAAH